MKKSQTFDVGEDCVFKIGSDAYFLLFVKFTPTHDILSCFLEDNDPPHAYFEASRALSSGIVRNFPSPASTFASRSESTSPCQSGEETSCSEPEKDFQRSSIVCKRWVELMLLISDSANMIRI